MYHSAPSNYSATAYNQGIPMVLMQKFDPLELLAVHEELVRLAEKSPRKAELVKLRYFLGCTMAESAQILGIAQATAEEDWTFAKAWLRRHFRRGEEKNALS